MPSSRIFPIKPPNDFKISRITIAEFDPLRAGAGYGIIRPRFSVWIRPFTDCLTGKETKKG